MMIIHAQAGEAAMERTDDLTALSLHVHGEPRTAVGEWGTWVDEDHVAVATAFLLELAGPAAEARGWRDAFDAMIAYATSKGWVDAEGRVRIHLVSAG